MFTGAGQRSDDAETEESVSGAAAVLPWLVLAAFAARAKAQAEADRFFQLSPDLMAVAGFDGFYKRVNPAYETHLGYTEHEVVGQPFMDFAHPDDREHTEATVRRLMQGKPLLVFEVRVVCKDGSYRWIEWRAASVPEEGLLYGVGRDVTERHRAESELRRLAAEQAARRRVATLVARGVPPTEVFSAVAEEVERLLDAQAITIGRLEPDGTLVIVASSGAATGELPVGSRLQLESGLALTVVARTGQPARVDDYCHSFESVRRTVQRQGIRCSVAVPITLEGAVWGAIAAGAEHAPFPADAEHRMAEFTDLVATAIANADSRSQLAASRRRIVAAADEARRRIERDLHDGTQQRLVSLGLAVRAAEADAPPDQSDLRAGLSRIAAGLQDAVAELREISRGIHPAILSEAGLGKALRTLARRSAIPVEIDVTADAPLPEPIEVAAYFVASEALANAAKHSRASRMELSLATRDGSLVLSIGDDGVGGAVSEKGSGLLGLQDRVEALGGTVTIDSPPGGGTSLVATLPLVVPAG
jgi:PAS domain S-box-containing protein